MKRTRSAIFTTLAAAVAVSTFGVAILNRIFAFEDLVGVWQGSLTTEEDAYVSSWTAHHYEDATIIINFEVIDHGITESFTHHGTWDVEGDTYTSHISKIVNEDETEEEAHFVFEYKIHSLTDTTFRYTHIDTGETYVSKRIRN